MIDLLENLDRIRFLMRFFFRIDFGFGFDVGGRKKLLRFDTGFSTLAVVTPIEIWHLLIPPKFQVIEA